MIKINLLPTKKARKTFTIEVGFKSNVMIFIIIIVVVVLFEGFTWYWLNSSISSLTQEKQTLSVKLKELTGKVTEVENFEKDKKIYEDKIEIIQNLKKNQEGPVHMLDEISHRLPERVWLVSIKETGGNINIIGSGMTNDAIVKYVNNLKATNIFKNVQLIESRQVIDSGVPIYSFSLTFTVNLDTV
ncbi:MAG: hypothetical protein A3D21_08520 [Nitrospirae bacterium RIFCSPHIGHO2_02_FULL_42_12]|nr:MAG: hypothetical protein A3D21_08520 [Nitrospirae bacterium RIFCSPHIGHO2_02_FULL_42_12]